MRILRQRIGFLIAMMFGVIVLVSSQLKLGMVYPFICYSFFVMIAISDFSLHGFALWAARAYEVRRERGENISFADSQGWVISRIAFFSWDYFWGSLAVLMVGAMVMPLLIRFGLFCHA